MTTRDAATPPVAGRWQESEKVKAARRELDLSCEGLDAALLDDVCNAVSEASGSAGAAPTKAQVRAELMRAWGSGHDHVGFSIDDAMKRLFPDS